MQVANTLSLFWTVPFNESYLQCPGLKFRNSRLFIPIGHNTTRRFYGARKARFFDWLSGSRGRRSGLTRTRIADGVPIGRHQLPSSPLCLWNCSAGKFRWLASTGLRKRTRTPFRAAGRTWRYWHVPRGYGEVAHLTRSIRAVLIYANFHSTAQKYVSCL